ncbi:MAG: WD40/YVTN/BNR-like repeat-containing protein [Candidatus Binatia bacterium]
MSGLPTQKTVYAFAYNPKDPKIMYAAVRDGLYLSSDEGKQWSLLAKSPRGIVAIAVHPSDPSKILVGTGNGKIYRSKDGGETWGLRNR